MEEREMKKIHLFIVTLITCSLITLFVACEKDEEIDLTTISVSKEQFTPSYTSAALQCSFATKATLRNVYVQYATSQDFAEYEEMEMAKADGVYSVVLDSLQDNTTYYVRYAVSNRYSSAVIEEISKFKTLQRSVPTITLKSISDIWDTHAKAEMALESDGGVPISEMGICWNTKTAPILENNKLPTKDTIVTLKIKELQPNSQYFVRAYAINKVGVAYSEEFEFTTFSLPEIRTEDITDIHSTIAMLHGTLVFNGNDTAAINGFCWSTNEKPTLDNDHIEIDTTSATYIYRLSNLNAETQYYVCAYAQNKIGIVYGETRAFTTQSAVIPIVTTSSVTNISNTSATIDGNVTNDGGATVTERGVVYSTSQNPTISNSKVTSGSGTGSFSCSLSNLQDATTYYARAYAINVKGIAYGKQIVFTTPMRPMSFSISPSETVSFSTGNLQYNSADNEWRFAESQLDYIGQANGNISSTYNGWVDLFGWSTSATNFGVSTSTNSSDYSGSFVDWGTNKIGNDAPNTWRTLTYEEWKYLLNNRLNASSLYGVAQVNGINGLIFLPDDWTCPRGVTFKFGFHSNNDVDYYAAYQTFTSDQWTKLEASGAIFLPAAGYRIGSNVFNVQKHGDYWSVAENDSNSAYDFHFYSGEARMHGQYYRDRGFSVRLVKDL